MGMLLVVSGEPLTRWWFGAEAVAPPAVLWGGAVWVAGASFFAPLAMLLNSQGRVKALGISSLVCVIIFLVSAIHLTEKFGIAGTIWALVLASALSIWPVAVVEVVRLLKGLANPDATMREGELRVMIQKMVKKFSGS